MAYPAGDDDAWINPNSFHDLHTSRDGPRNVPKVVVPLPHQGDPMPKDPGHPYAETKHIKFDFFDQRTSNSPFGYEHFVSLPPRYDGEPDQKWPLILFLHGMGESQRGENESSACLRHGIPKVILCYDKWKSDPANMMPAISIPRPARFQKKTKPKKVDRSSEPVSAEVGALVAENFITVTPSLNMDFGYGWNAAVLSALLDEIVARYRVDPDRIHVTGFSMGGYGTWELALHTPRRFASVVPICGGGDRLRAGHISHLAHWVHHGDLDDIIPVAASQQMVAALKKAGAAEVEFTRYPDLLHDSWSVTYSNPEVYRWMLSHRRQVKGEEEVVLAENKVVLNEQA